MKFFVSFSILLFFSSFPAKAIVSESIKSDFKKEISLIRDFIIIDFSKADKHLKKLEAKFRKVKDPEIAYSFCLTKMRFHSSYGNFARVQLEVNKARKIALYFNPTNQQKLYLDFYAALYDELEPDIDNILVVCEKVLKQSDKDDYYLLIQAYVARAKAYSLMNKVKEAMENLRYAEVLAQKYNRDAYHYFVANSKAQILSGDDQFDAALQIYDSLIRFANDHGWKYVKQYLNLSKAEVYLCSGDLSKAKSYLDLVAQNEDETELRDLYQLFGSLNYYYRQVGNIDSSYLYAIKQNKVDDHLENFKNQSLIDELEQEFKLEVDEYRLEQEKQKNQQLKLIIVFFVISVVAITLISFFFIRQKSLSNKLLKRQKDEIDESNKQISNALLLKENMIKEIHHRVKNNLQIISSILNLESRNLTDEATIKILEAVNDRIRAIALVHNQLHLVQDSAYIQLGPYLNMFIGHLQESFSGWDKEIEVSVDVDNMDLEIDQAMPIGLIMCELISNSFKHAFGDRSKGKVEVTFKQDPENPCFYELGVKDNGVGYQGTEELFSQDSTGMEIIYAFIQQLDGDYRIENQGQGLGVFIRFKLTQPTK